MGVGGHGRELGAGAQGVSSAKATQEAHAPRDGPEPGKATAPTITSVAVAAFVLGDVSFNVRVRGVYAVSVVCRVIVRVITLNSVVTFIPFQVTILGGGTRIYRVRGRLRIQGHPFRQGGKEQYS